MARDDESVLQGAQAEEVRVAEPGEIAAPQTLEEASVIDVEPPHEGIHSWRQYMLHMSTIVLGVLIAIGLEQSVEAMHHAHERAELRESLRRDTEQAILNAQSSERAEIPSIHWLTGRQELVRDALSAHRSLGSLPRTPHVSTNMPTDPAWSAAKSSGMLSLLTQDEVEVYSYADLLMDDGLKSFSQGVAASGKRGQFEFKFSDPNHPGTIDLSTATTADLNQYRDLLLEEGVAWSQYRILCEYIRGVETAIRDGVRDPAKIYAAQHRFYQPVAR